MLYNSSTNHTITGFYANSFHSYNREKLQVPTEPVFDPLCYKVNGRLTGLVTLCVETAFYDRLLKEKKRRYRSDRKTRKKS
jgi:hypothetical protein